MSSTGDLSGKKRDGVEVGTSMRIGGLLRCCIDSIGRYDGPKVAGETVIGCGHHADPDTPTARIAADGVWEWVGRDFDGSEGTR